MLNKQTFIYYLYLKFEVFHQISYLELERFKPGDDSMRGSSSIRCIDVEVGLSPTLWVPTPFVEASLPWFWDAGCWNCGAAKDAMTAIPSCVFDALNLRNRVTISCDIQVVYRIGFEKCNKYRLYSDLVKYPKI